MGLFNKKEKIINCPKDQVPMIKKTSQGITIDKCKKCGGIWLDKGEIENIVKKIEAHQKKMAKSKK
jgi:Zn-finger nucleic acid-binding protein